MVDSFHEKLQFEGEGDLMSEEIVMSNDQYIIEEGSGGKSLKQSKFEEGSVGKSRKQSKFNTRNGGKSLKTSTFEM